MKIQPSKKQNEAKVIADNNLITLYGGSIRGGKSYWGCLMIISYCFKYPNSRWLMMRASVPTLTRTLLVTFNELLAKGFNQYVTNYNKQTNVLTWNNGSEIIFMAENYANDKDLNRFKGLEINGAFIDEVNEIQEVTFDKIIERAGSWFHAGDINAKILMSCNPANNWVKKRFYDKFKNGSLPDKVAYVPAKITDNPHIPQSYYNSLKLLPTYQYEVFVNGNWDIQLKVGGEFYKCFELDKHVYELEYNDKLPLHISWDDNVNPYLPMGIYQIEGKTIRCIDEIAGVTPSNTVKAVCMEFIRKYPAHNAGLFVYGDATAQKEDTKMEKGYNFYRLITDHLKDYKPQLRVLKSNPSVVMRGNWINTVMENEIGGLRIEINKSCTNTINDLILTKEAPDGTKNKEMETNATTKVRFQKVGHFSDCFTGETLINTINGDVRIDKIKVGDFVLTRKGYKKVLKTYNKGVKEVVNYTIGYNKLTCTKEHKVWTKEKGFYPIGHLILWGTFCIFNKNTNTWKETLLNITASNLQDTQTVKEGQKEFTTQGELRLIINQKRLDFMYTNTCVKLVKSLKAHVFIMLTKTRLITTFQTLFVSAEKLINRNTCNVTKEKKYLKLTLTCSQETKRKNGTNQKMAENGTQRIALKGSKAKEYVQNVLSAKVYSWVLMLLGKKQNIVLQNAKTGFLQESTEPKLRQVYDIQVDDCHEFFANNILVHNCLDYVMVQAFANDFEQYQKGSKEFKPKSISFVRKYNV